MNQVEVREVTQSDWRPWRKIRLRALEDSPAAFGSTYAREIEFRADDWQRRLDPASGPCVLATTAGQPIALGGGYRESDRQLHVVTMWVEPSWRGHGVGTRILDVIVAWGRDRGLACRLDVASDNPSAQAMYERYGFVATGETHLLRPGAGQGTHRMLLDDPPQG